MNKDHATDLQHMLQHFNGLSAAAASANPQLVDMDLSSLTVTTGSTTTHTIPINPPMATWNDRRQALIDMTMAARAALGIVTPSDDHHPAPTPTPTPNYHYVPPSGADWPVLGGVLLYFACYALAHTGCFDDGTVLAGALETYAGVAAESLRWVVDRMLVPVVGVHAAEMWWFRRTRLAPAGVAMTSRVGLMWQVSCFAEGFRSFGRWDGMVEGLKGGKGE
ncbi:hypothetical protein B0T17DRAFT_19390 [Bombardia bombarda]|uniref:DUF2470 domain-containing protein n=1 Tax=Bombardia bombarda TaxID=252184 RepID=A0AA40CEU3_9PEZI|nr:hypothetical protein B0T17DRAFT_19390 [Bombardia bombarda]